MSSTITIKFSIDTTDASIPLGMSVLLDNTEIFKNTHIIGKEYIEYIMPDDDGEHLLQFVMTGKTQEHTKIDTDGNIVSDARLTVNDLEFDDIKLGQVFIDHAVYHHNFNSAGENIQEKFYGEIGCNGHVDLKFSTPIYLWLLENF
jgi:hypothetical protein